ncbi:hypothetical protein T06_5857, partial [Trichinella sp. T6]
CSHHFVLNVASVSIEFVPDCSCIVHWCSDVSQLSLCGFTYHKSKKELIVIVEILLSQSRSVRTHSDNELVLVAIHHTSLRVRVAIIAFAEYFCRVLCESIFSESNYVEIYMKEIVDKYVITKHYHQLMPLSLATNKSKKPRKQTMDTYEVKWVSLRVT